MASTTGGIFESNHEEGYSVDNIAPGVPEGLMAMVLEDGIELSAGVQVLMKTFSTSC